MAVYVDDTHTTPQGKVRNMRMCYMTADTPRELRNMVFTMQLPFRYIAYPNRPGEHVVICVSQRKQAVEAGAIEITHAEYIAFMKRKKQSWKGNKSGKGKDEFAIDKQEKRIPPERVIWHIHGKGQIV